MNGAGQCDCSARPSGSSFRGTLSEKDEENMLDWLVDQSQCHTRAEYITRGGFYEVKLYSWDLCFVIVKLLEAQCDSQSVLEDCTVNHFMWCLCRKNYSVCVDVEHMEIFTGPICYVRFWQITSPRWTARMYWIKLRIFRIWLQVQIKSFMKLFPNF